MASISLPRHLGGLHSAGDARLPGAPGFGVRVYVAVSRSKLDRVLAVRAGQLVSTRGRERLVGALERAIAAARAPRALTSAVAPNPTAVLGNRSALLDLIDRLRSPEPVAAAGVARLLVLLRDGCSPLYTPPRPGLLARELDHVQRALAP